MQIGTPVPPPALPQGRECLPSGARAHEQTDANTGLIFWIVVAMIAGAIVTHAALYGFLKGVVYTEQAGQPQFHPPADLRPASPPEPRLQVNEEADLARLRAQEDARLSGYGWMDKQNGIVRIPVARAMESALLHGLPQWSDGTAHRPGDIRASAPRDPESMKTNVK
jgi:hypothetical protein